LRRQSNSGPPYSVTKTKAASPTGGKNPQVRYQASRAGPRLENWGIKSPESPCLKLGFLKTRFPGRRSPSRDQSGMGFCPQFSRAIALGLWITRLSISPNKGACSIKSTAPRKTTGKKAQSMKADQSKASREMQVFLEFIEKSGLPIECDSVENRPSREPDILCMHKKEGFIAFELGELCNEEIAETIAKDIRSGNTEPRLMWIADPTHRTIL
jgi:hypothetical protein